MGSPTINRGHVLNKLALYRPGAFRRDSIMPALWIPVYPTVLKLS